MTTIVAKYFTPSEAERTLPLVKQIVKDIIDTSNEVKEIAETITVKYEDDPKVISLIEKIKGYIKELEEIGCYYKEYNFIYGLVDFPSIINGKEVFLCWRSDESGVKFYHDIEAGYMGRKLIPEEYFIN